jgi:hypothetical protein
MEAAKLKKVEDRIDRGVNAIPAAGENSGWISKNTIPAGPAPTPAINSGKKLDNTMLGPSNRISNGQGREYDGAPDNDEDDAALRASKLA